MAKLEAEGKIFVKKKKKKKDAEDSPAAQTPTPQGTPCLRSNRIAFVFGAVH